MYVPATETSKLVDVTIITVMFPSTLSVAVAPASVYILPTGIETGFRPSKAITGATVSATVAVGVGVSVGLSVSVGVNVSVKVDVSVGLNVSVGDSVNVGVKVLVGVAVSVIVIVGVEVDVPVKVRVAVQVNVGVGVIVGTKVKDGTVGPLFLQATNDSVNIMTTRNSQEFFMIFSPEDFKQLYFQSTIYIIFVNIHRT